MISVAFFTARDFRRWLELHHADEQEIVVQFYKKESGRAALTYAEALDEALCFGWIDGVRKRHDASSFTIRFTPRRPNSIWSQVNVRNAERLIQSGRMHTSGAAVFARRSAGRTGVYTFENRLEKFPPDLRRTFRANSTAWNHFSNQPAGYRRTVIGWVVSAKQEVTRKRRLAHVISVSARGKRIDLMKPFSEP